MPILDDKASASSIECVVRITEHFFLFADRPATTDHMKRRASGSIPEDGSSSSTIEGDPIIAIAT